MNVRSSARYPTVLNVVLVATMAHSVPPRVNHIVTASLCPAAVPTRFPTSPAGVESTHARAVYDQIAQRDVFNLAPPAHASAVVSPSAPNLHIKLLGTSIQSVGGPFAIIEVKDSGQQLLLRVGQTIPETGRLVEVKRSSVIIDRGGGELVNVAMGSQDPTPGTVAPNPLQMGRFRPTREDRGFIQR
jgi:hypothetical protein